MELSMLRRRATLAGCGLALLLLAGSAAAALQDENLLQPLPDGFKVGNQQHNDHAALTEMVPSNESVDQWTQMVTTQIYFDRGALSFDNYQAQMEQRWKGACDSVDSQPVTSGKENGYDFRLWVQSCHFNDPKHPPEVTWFKMIKGNDSTYVVQVAFHADPQKDQVVHWMKYLRGVTVCDTRLKDRPCPAGMQ